MKSPKYSNVQNQNVLFEKPNEIWFGFLFVRLHYKRPKSEQFNNRTKIKSDKIRMFGFQMFTVEDFVTLLFYLDLHTYHYKSDNPLPHTCVTSFMNDP